MSQQQEQKQQSYKQGGIVLAVSILLVGLGVFALNTYFDDSQLYNNDGEVAGVDNLNDQQNIGVVNLEIVSRKGETKEYSVGFLENETAYDMLKRMELQYEDFDFDAKIYEYDGEVEYFVEKINGVKPNGNKEFWKFKINGEDSFQGVSKYIVQYGDKITFELDKVELGN